VRPATLAFLLVLAVPTAVAYPAPAEAPSYVSDCASAFDRRFVFDFVGAVPAPWGPAIEEAGCDVYRLTGAHFVLVAVNGTDGEPLETYALHLFERWGVGDAERQDGMMLLYVEDYAIDGRSSAVRIEVGYGLEGVVNARVAQVAIALMHEASANAIEAGQSVSEARSQALGTGSEFLLRSVAEGYTDGAFPEPAPRAPPLAFWIVAIAIVLIVIVVLAATAEGRRGRPHSGWGYSSGSGAWVGGLAGSLGGSSGSGSFGGGSFGGGRSGGGGGSGGF